MKLKNKYANVAIAKYTSRWRNLQCGPALYPSFLSNNAEQISRFLHHAAASCINTRAGRVTECGNIWHRVFGGGAWIENYICVSWDSPSAWSGTCYITDFKWIVPYGKISLDGTM